jgi:hypothetical protein
MADTAIHPIPKQGKFRRALAAVGAWLQALVYTGFDYTLDRTERLERELTRLKEELRQIREASCGDAHLGGASSLIRPNRPSAARLARVKTEKRG